LGKACGGASAIHCTIHHGTVFTFYDIIFPLFHFYSWHLHAFSFGKHIIENAAAESPGSYLHGTAVIKRIFTDH